MPLTFIQGWIPVFITGGFHPMGSIVVYTSEKDQLYDAKLVRTESKPILLSTTGRVYPEKIWWCRSN